MIPVIKFKKIHPNFCLPKRESIFAAGFDLRYMPDGVIVVEDCDNERDSEDGALLIKPLERKLLPLGFQIEIPPGYEMQLRPRSGLAKKVGLTILNSPGTIDSDYRGPVGAILINLGSEDAFIYPGMRICQGVIASVPAFNVEMTTELSDTERGSGGFGSTGQR